jgi:hypothetical protein
LDFLPFACRLVLLPGVCTFSWACVNLFENEIKYLMKRRKKEEFGVSVSELEMEEAKVFNEQQQHFREEREEERDALT